MSFTQAAVQSCFLAQGCRDLELQITSWSSPENPDPLVTKEWPLASLDSAAAIVAVYLLFIIVGSLVMSPDSVKPINLNAFKFLYNPMQIILCSYMCVEAGVQAYRNNYSVVCNSFDYKNPPLANLLWLFYVSKVFDFADTVFIVLGKKWKQLSVLHVYHHTTIFLIYWLNLRVGFDGDIYLTIILNGYIHTIMYTYYFVSQHTKITEKKVKQYKIEAKDANIPIWWKKYLTGAQLLQFTLMNLQAGFLLYTGCSQFPANVTLVYLIYIQTLFWLFMQFFVSNYCQSKKKSSKEKTK